MAYWKEVDSIIEVCRMSLLEIRFELEDAGYEDSAIGKFEEKYNKIRLC